MKSWSQWIGLRKSKRARNTKTRQLGSELLESRQLLAGDIVQAVAADGVAVATGPARLPRAPLSVDSVIDLGFEGDSNERQIVSARNNIENAVVASNADGGFVVVRQQQSGSDRNGFDLFAQIYDRDGKRVGTQFRVNEEFRGNQINPDIAMDADGSFTVVFQSDFGAKGWEVMARTFDADGVPTRTREFSVNSANPSVGAGRGDQQNPSVAYIGLGNYVVAWNGRGDGANEDPDGVFRAARCLQRSGWCSHPSELDQDGNAGQSLGDFHHRRLCRRLGR